MVSISPLYKHFPFCQLILSLNMKKNPNSCDIFMTFGEQEVVKSIHVVEFSCFAF